MNKNLNIIKSNKNKFNFKKKIKKLKKNEKNPFPHFPNPNIRKYP